MVREAAKESPVEVLDVSAGKRFDTEGCLFRNLNTREECEETRRIIEARKL